jgi:hypothetical protein
MYSIQQAGQTVNTRFSIRAQKKRANAPKSNGSKKEGENMPHPLYPTGYGWMWSDGVIRASDSYSEL